MRGPKKALERGVTGNAPDIGTLLRHFAGNAHDLLWMITNTRPRVAAMLIGNLVRERLAMARARSEYAELSRAEVLARKRSRRIFIFGSGYSLNEISDAEWARIAGDDTLGFSGSIYLKKAPLTYLLLRAWTETSKGSLAWKNDAEEVLGAIATNPFLKDTVFVLQSGLTAIFNNRLIGHRMWDHERRMYFYLADKVSQLPHRDLAKGIVNGKGTLCSAISLAVSLGYEEIVLAGVDLYDNRYFWLSPDKTLGWSEAEQKLVASDQTARGLKVESPHNTVNNGIIDFVGMWGGHLDKHHGVRLSVYNPRSLLTRTLPVFAWPS